MRRSLLSSLLALIIMGASCDQIDQNAKADPGQASKETEIETIVEKDSTLERSVRASETMEQAPTHQTPDPSKLDSVKNSYPKKK